MKWQRLKCCRYLKWKIEALEKGERQHRTIKQEKNWAASCLRPFLIVLLFCVLFIDEAYVGEQRQLFQCLKLMLARLELATFWLQVTPVRRQCL